MAHPLLLGTWALPATQALLFLSGQRELQRGSDATLALGYPSEGTWRGTFFVFVNGSPIDWPLKEHAEPLPPDGAGDSYVVPEWAHHGRACASSRAHAPASGTRPAKDGKRGAVLAAAEPSAHLG